MRKILLIIILLLAATLRIYAIGNTPASLDWDEAALGYNAYAILHTGKDEYGQMLPLILRSFDDYKPGLYSYLAIPSLALFGLTPFAVRLPAVIIGILAVLATYFLAKELFQIDTRTKEKGNSKFLAFPLIAAFLLAISPWHIQFSRVAFEAGVAMACNLFAVLSFLKGLKKPRFLLLSASMFAANLYMYQSEKLFIPLLLGALLIIYRKEIVVLPKRMLATAITIGLILTLPLVVSIIHTPPVLSRANGVSIMTQSNKMTASSDIRMEENRKTNDYLGKLFDNKKVTIIKEIAQGYLSHFDLNWLFIRGDQPRHHAPGMGLLYLWELPFLLIGVFQLLFHNFNSKTKHLLVAWLLLAPVPAAFTFDVPHAVRTLNALPTFQLITAIGIGQVFAWIQVYKGIGQRVKIVPLLLFLSFVVWNGIYFLNQYFVQLNHFTSQNWQYGYKETITFLKPIQNKYKKIIVSNKDPMDQSYIFFLFYLQYPPQKYQQEITGNTDKNKHNFLQYEFRAINWEKEQKSHDILYIGSPADFPTEIQTIKTVNYLDGQAAIKIVEG
jgi:4-amino-4-deoxy-L-arabinose transferase-like glycosyltransferase